MRKIACSLVFAFAFVLLFSGTCFAFTEAPVAVLVMGDSYASLDSELVDLWQERVKRRFRFPDYKMMSQQEIKKGLASDLPSPESKRPYFRKEQLLDIADIIPAELVFVIWVDRLNETVYQSYFPFGDTVRRVNVSIDVTAYRKTDNKYLVQKIRYSDLNNIAISTPARRVATDSIAEAVNKIKEELPRLEKREETAGKI